MTFTLKRRLLGLVGVALLLYTVFWFIVANQARTRVVDLINDLNANGAFHLEYKHVNLAGYPFHITLRLSKPELTIDYPALLGLANTSAKGAGLSQTIKSSNPLALHVDMLGRSYSLDLPYDSISVLNIDGKTLSAKLDYNQARLALVFRKNDLKHGVAQYFSQFLHIDGWWNKVKSMNLDISNIMMSEQDSGKTIYGAGNITVKAKFFPTQNGGMRIEGAYNGEQSYVGPEFNDYLQRLRQSSALAPYFRDNAVLRMMFADMLLWPEAGQTKRRFNFIAERSSAGGWGLEVRKYGAQDLLSSSSMDLSFSYRAPDDKPRSGVKVCGTYAIHYQPQWYAVAARSYVPGSSGVASNYAMPRLHDFEYWLADFDFELRQAPVLQVVQLGKNEAKKALLTAETSNSSNIAVLPTRFSLRNNRYTVSIKGGMFLTQEPFFQGKSEVILHNYPQMLVDLAGYLNRIEQEEVVDQSQAINAQPEVLPGGLLLLLKEAANSSDHSRALFYLHKGAHGAIMLGKRSLAEIFGA
ncbi:MAG: DUF2125 domain-containing protein [Proteobacteria bacterium]|nr:DUF2125 domain-containing protein [Pseudomonadota bacterium]